MYTDMRLDAAIADAVQRLARTTDSARLDAEILLCQAIDMPRSYLFAHPEDELDPLAVDRFEKLVTRRLDGEPIAYITGHREFWSHRLLVTRETLIPRPETELLVELALREIPTDANWRILDLGTGSGAIAIAIASERIACEIVAVEQSSAALAVAKENIRQCNLANVTCLHGDWTAPVQEQTFDLIVSNPPYVNDDDEALSALRFEPLSALAAGADGLDDIRILATDCRTIIADSGCLMIEHGCDQQQAVAEILARANWVDISCHNDLAGRPRVTVARRNGKQAP